MLPGGFPRGSVAIKDLPLFISMSCLKVKKTPNSGSERLGKVGFFRASVREKLWGSLEW